MKKSPQKTIEQYFIFDEISTYYDENSLFKHNDYCGEIDSNGKVLFVVKAEAIERLYDYFAIKKDGKWGLYNKYFEIIIEPQYQELSTAYNNIEKYFWAKLNDKYGLIDKNNNLLTGFIFDNYRFCFNYDKGYFIVEKNNKCGVIDVYGHIIFEMIYENIDITNECGYITLNGKKALVDNNGRFLNVDFDSLNNCIEKRNTLENLEKSFVMS